MTRINVIPANKLHDTHLLAETREIVRIPNQLLSARLKPEYVPTYRLGPGHVKFFTTRLSWLLTRYNEIYNECIVRGFKPQWYWPDGLECIGDYTPTQEAIHENTQRIIERTIDAKRNPRYYGKEFSKDEFVQVAYGDIK